MTNKYELLFAELESAVQKYNQFPADPSDLKSSVDKMFHLNIIIMSGIVQILLELARRDGIDLRKKRNEVPVENVSVPRELLARLAEHLSSYRDEGAGDGGWASNELKRDRAELGKLLDV